VTEGLDLSNKTYLITGCNSGLGEETVRVLTLRGARVIALARTLEKAEGLAHRMNDKVVPIACELSEPKSIKIAIDAVRNLNLPLDGMIANAGIMALPQLKKKYHFELQFFTNHVGHFYLVTSLLDKLASNGRVVMLSSSAHEMTYPEGINFTNLSGENGYSSWKSYGQSKLCNLLFARHLATRLPDSSQSANAVHPGVIATSLMRNMNSFVRIAGRAVSPIFMKTVAQGAATQVYVATHASLSRINGRYFSDCNEKKSSRYGSDSALAARLWDETEKIVKGWC
jgi:NAD(P)-dependent dehydrogenase (short-subunit alcohol dehydrogenase family)